jgi:hypothetical protein
VAPAQEQPAHDVDPVAVQQDDGFE